MELHICQGKLMIKSNSRKENPKKEVTVRVLPDLRPIQIIDEGEIINK